MTQSRLIIADENIPQVREWFAPLGSVRTLPGRSMTAADVADADILLVRSVTPVGADLLAGSRVGFVGTATIGTDHLDLDWLHNAGITVASAPGSNAQSVVDYVLSALASRDGVLEALLAGLSRVGVIGLGNVGGRLLRRLRQLGVAAIGYDPLLTDDELPRSSLDEVLSCDVICVHVPLTQTGDFPTFHMLDQSRLARLPRGALLLNAGRGGAIDNQALVRVLSQRHDLSVVLDVWEGEPSISPSLLQRVILATPHIAGYSLDGKLAGTRMLLDAACEYLKMDRELDLLTSTSIRAGVTVSRVEVAGLRDALLAVYDPRQDDAALRDGVNGGSPIGQHFDWLRRCYPVRREIAATVVANAAEVGEPTRQLLAKAGFRLG